MSKESSGIPWWLILLQGIFAIILGLLLLSSPGMTTLVLIQFLGIYWLIAGVFNIVGIFLDHKQWGWKLFAGILGVIAGLLVIQHPLWSTVLIPTTLVVILGVVGLIFGIVGLIAAFQGGGLGSGYSWGAGNHPRVDPARLTGLGRHRTSVHFGNICTHRRYCRRGASLPHEITALSTNQILAHGLLTVRHFCYFMEMLFVYNNLECLVGRQITIRQKGFNRR